VRIVALQRDGTDLIEVAGVEFHAGSISRGISRTTTSYFRCHRSWSVARPTG
jgi:DNA-binding LytR/AlgR family response regulator